ncbi:class I SAM-dependent methyltransferase [Hydrogenivirga sp. 128-5-R1-1]|uniref:class I SAM-dependent methyltransferase n=1 Tax=Hydrogenivirga sp. 128-5-R1-1 TaxID=392423 RepID=UPI00015EF79A|nr:class I SAM-dependent methyltransferase [Hydrogenivirga sp. 128-5-R1-1]EDP74910.1 Methylase involved in ubiquinone/menaquinone biosynthesis-like protein [Hydrogenivirga sp. 128-5-R1-1]
MQDDVFKKEEADKWFERNKEGLKPKADLILKAIRDYNLICKNSKVLEVGASNGYRLAKIHEEFGSEVHAIEPSKEAIKDGKSKWSFINFYQNTLAEFNEREHTSGFDLIIVNSVLHWIDRSTLLLSVAKIDTMLRWGGHLILGDFQTQIPLKRKYHHKEGLYTYKQRYKDIFTSTNLYIELMTLAYNHDDKSLSNININNFFSVSLLRKQELYIETP